MSFEGRERRGAWVLPDPQVPTGPLRDLIARNGISIAEAGRLYARETGFKSESGQRMMFRWVSGETVSLYAADKICTLLGTHLAVVYGLEACA